MNAPELVEVTPGLAREWLSRNQSNPRRIASKYVDIYAKDMSSGRWQDCPDPICFKDGKVVNGQHRLSAIVNSGVAVKFFVHWDWHGETMDVGRSRSASTVFRNNQIPRASRVATLAGALKVSDFGKVVADRLDKVSAQELLALYSENKDDIDFCSSLPYVRSVGGCELAYWILLKNGVDKVSIQAFAKDLSLGNGLRSHPLREVARQMLEEKHLFKSGVVTYAVIEAWNKCARNQSVKKYVPARHGEDMIKPVLATYKEME